MAKFWTDKTFLPYQKHKFKVQLELWYIQGFDQGQAAIDTQSIISKNKIHRVDIPPHFIRSVDLPKFSTSIENTAGTFSPSSNIQAEAGDFEDLTITFYMVDDLVSLIPSIFYAYYLDFGTGNSAPVPFLQKKSKLGAKFNSQFVSTSKISITMLNEASNRVVEYTHVLPLSYDLGDLDYGDSAIVEPTMTFSYNVTQAANGTGVTGTP